MTPNPKKKLAFIDHPFHKSTRSSEFFKDILRQEYEIVVYFHDLRQGGQTVNANILNAGHFDVILVWQNLPSPGLLARLNCKNLFWIPMYDAEFRRSSVIWRLLKGLNIKLICFSKVLHEIAGSYGLTSFYLQYFPELNTKTVSYGNPRVFFWQRTNELEWSVVRQILARNNIEKVIVRDDPDPDHVFVEPDPDDIRTFQIEIVRNLKVAVGTRKEDYLELLSSCNVFIAPRLREGIGLSFLEAMALGMCVVGADWPTLNEYISPSVNGFLFDSKQAASISLTHFAECGHRAKAYIAEGRKQWLASIPSVLQFIATPLIIRRSHWSVVPLFFWAIASRLRENFKPALERIKPFRRALLK